MKRKLKNSKRQEAESGRQGAALSVVGQQSKEQNAGEINQSNAAVVTHLEFPPPEYLLELARGEANRKLLQHYRETIWTLRNEKGFSFREIADWLKENGVEADYNSVYRVYTKGMSEADAAEAELREAEEEREG